MPFYPGPGLGGHCIPIDPVYLQWKARIDGFEPRFIQVASEINERHARVRRHDGRWTLLNDRGRPMRGSSVLVLGVAYKRDVGDVRESPAIEIVKLLRSRGAKVSYSDPFVPSLVIDGQVLQNQPLSPEMIASRDLVLVVTDHTDFDYGALSSARMVLDTRNALQGARAENIRRL